MAALEETTKRTRMKAQDNLHATENAPRPTDAPLPAGLGSGPGGALTAVPARPALLPHWFRSAPPSQTWVCILLCRGREGSEF